MAVLQVCAIMQMLDGCREGRRPCLATTDGSSSRREILYIFIPNHHTDTQHLLSFIEGVFLCLLRLLMKIQGLQKTNEDILRFYHKRFCCWHLSKFLLLTDIVFISKYVGKLKSNKCVAAKDLVVHECISAVSRFSSSFCPTVKPMVPDTPPTSQPLLRNTNENEKKYSWAFGRNTLVNSWGEGEWYICLYWDKAHFRHYG